ncbi:hypothetical protein C5167_023097 [Papaver somniferum]|uniref:Glycosyltransferase 61 catalytic domain-containing protein n=1 Tax=Papaver somniferum TaxID=3469 RepID=A0A4Y7JJR2_PAPSO|nr:uncharacterized protein LOC113279282 [Papaver somniferum]RZC61354.1 hypothetical protein C5167_023097 [Papaver somniferum]
MDKSENYDIRLEKIFSKRFGRNDAKRLVYGILVGGLLIILLTSSSILNLQLAANAGFRPLMDGIWNLPVCNVFEPMSDFCEIEGHIRVEGKSSSIYFTSSTNESWRIKPYARKGDNDAMKHVTELSIISFLETDKQATAPDCSMNHNTPAIVFSTGGYAGNQFHDFTEILLPLYLTSRHFHQEVQFLVTNSQPYWLKKYEPLIKQLSRYPIIDIEKEVDVHCYQKVTVGLKHHKDLGIDPTKSPKGYSMVDFAEFLRMSYSLERSSALKMDEHFLKKNDKKKPRLLILSRKRTRRFTNEEEIVATAKALGYEVIVAEPGVTTTLSNFTHIANSCDVMVAVHGAGCTNLLFLPSNAILIQVFPLGPLEKIGKHIYGEPAEAMNLRYLEYNIRVEESSLVDQYPADHAVLRDPDSFSEKGWSAVKSVYLDQQSVKLDIGRFKKTLLKALELLHH